jgi:hypothetical protein
VLIAASHLTGRSRRRPHGDGFAGLRAGVTGQAVIGRRRGCRAALQDLVVAIAALTVVAYVIGVFVRSRMKTDRAPRPVAWSAAAAARRATLTRS